MNETKAQMTVAELIAHLQKLPADLPVYLADWNERYESDMPLGIEDVPVVVEPMHTLPTRVVLGEPGSMHDMSER